jgi:hypothetical protein
VINPRSLSTICLDSTLYQYRQDDDFALTLRIVEKVKIASTNEVCQNIFALSLKIVYRVKIASYFTHVIDPFFITSTKGAVTSEFSRRGEAQLGMSTNLHK